MSVPSPPGFTSPDYSGKAAYADYLLRKEKPINIGEPAIASLEDLEVEYEAAKSEYTHGEATPENQLKMLLAESAFLKAKLKSVEEKVAHLETQKPIGKSSFLKGDVIGGLKTRRGKHRNGPSRVRRHRSERVSGRKDKA